MNHLESPLFSILITSYNNAIFLEECIQSIFQQTYSNWEIVIVDDASTDNSISIYEKYKADDRFKIYFNNKNKGVGFSKHRCVLKAKGVICGFVDPDDSIATDALEILVKLHLDNPNHSIIYSTHYVCNEFLNDKVIADYVGQIPTDLKSWSVRLPTISHFASFKRTNYFKTEGISDLFRKAEDKDLYYKLEETGPVLFLNRPLYNYRHHSNNISRNNNSSAAFHYQLTAVLRVVLRSHNRKKTFSKIPFKKYLIIQGALFVALETLKAKKPIACLGLLIEIGFCAPVLTIKCIIGQLLKWKKQRLSVL
ncbi:MAG: glycosyltransferase family 2 protein [Deltaproteobacteria bacterium]|nr:glycosyltransferase family 2 protein [Deltaproteobacteria bacterium]